MTERADVVVVGGGIIGCGIAAELACRGVSVVLVERAQIGAGFRVAPAALTLAYAERARAAGAEIRTNTEVKQILLGPDAVRGVATDGGVVTAPTVVNAAGPWAAKLARTTGSDFAAVPIGGLRGWLLLTEPRPGLMRHLVV